jgi:hypothetical protein
MKTIFTLLLMLVTVGANAATHTSTATPSATPSFTRTITPTFTPTPIAIYKSAYMRNYCQPNEFLQADGVSEPLTYTVAGPEFYLTQYLSQTAATLGTSGAKVRINWTIPANFAPFNSQGKGYLVPYIVGIASVTNTAVPLLVDVARMSFNAASGTATTVYTGVSQTITARTSNALRNNTVSRVPLVLPASLTQTTLVPGDQISLLITKENTVAAGLLRIIRVEFEFQDQPYLKP